MLKNDNAPQLTRSFDLLQTFLYLFLVWILIQFRILILIQTVNNHLSTASFFRFGITKWPTAMSEGRRSHITRTFPVARPRRRPSKYLHQCSDRCSPSPAIRTSQRNNCVMRRNLQALIIAKTFGSRNHYWQDILNFKAWESYSRSRVFRIGISQISRSTTGRGRGWSRYKCDHNEASAMSHRYLYTPPTPTGLAQV